MDTLHEYRDLLNGLATNLYTDPSLFSGISVSIPDIVVTLQNEIRKLPFLAQKWVWYNDRANNIAAQLQHHDLTAESLSSALSLAVSLVDKALEDADYYAEPDETHPVFDLTHAASPNISVVMNLYKRPDALLEQLESVEQQTVKPSEIVLFQDHVQGDVYQISLSDRIKERFSNVRISEENIGVWSRFFYADEVCTGDYICVLDDDTIPGSRWLENCYMHMLQQEGIYSTVGVVLFPHGKYPLQGYYRIGWTAPIQKTVEVDFGGHSWFMKREHLHTMVQSSGEVHDEHAKYVGEDIWLSYSNFRAHGIRTIVPQHYMFDFSFWGSNPKTAGVYGTQAQAVSMSAANLYAMNHFIERPVFHDWKTLSLRSKDYTDYIYSQVKTVDGNEERNASIKQ